MSIWHGPYGWSIEFPWEQYAIHWMSWKNTDLKPCKQGFDEEREREKLEENKGAFNSLSWGLSISKLRGEQRNGYSF